MYKICLFHRSFWSIFCVRGHYLIFITIAYEYENTYHFTFSLSCFSIRRHKVSKKQPCENITVAYYFCEELIPYRTSVRGRVVTLGQFKELLTKKGNYRYKLMELLDFHLCPFQAVVISKQETNILHNK